MAETRYRICSPLSAVFTLAIDSVVYDLLHCQLSVSCVHVLYVLRSGGSEGSGNKYGYRQLLDFVQQLATLRQDLLVL